MKDFDQLKDYQKKQQQQPGSKDFEKPIFSIHIPGDFNGVRYLLDEYEDAEKIAEFSLKKIKEKICKPN